MYEVEAKVRLTEADFKRLMEEIPKFAKKKDVVINKDSYYFADVKGYYMRIREKNGKGILTFKIKKRKQGIEVNDEIEIPLKKTEDFRKFLSKIGINVKIRKEKNGVIYRHGNIQLELHYVKRLGHFLEIEILVGSKSEIPQAKKKLNGIFRRLGFSKQDFENKTYLELLKKKRKLN